MICLSDISCFIHFHIALIGVLPPDLVSNKPLLAWQPLIGDFLSSRGRWPLIMGWQSSSHVTSVSHPVQFSDSDNTMLVNPFMSNYLLHFFTLLKLPNIRDPKGFVVLGFIVGLEKKWQNRNHQICIPASDPEILSHSRSPEPGRVTEPHTPWQSEYRHQRLICACFTPTLEREVKKH